MIYGKFQNYQKRSPIQHNRYFGYAGNWICDSWQYQ